MRVSAMKAVGAGRLTMTSAYRPQPDSSDVYGLAKRAVRSTGGRPRADRAMPSPTNGVSASMLARTPRERGRLLPNDRRTIAQAPWARNENAWDLPQDCLYPGDSFREEHGCTQSLRGAGRQERGDGGRDSHRLSRARQEAPSRSQPRQQAG